MYFPFLRGKQFELLALRELTALPLDHTKVSPIIEPLKADTKSIITMAKQMPKNLQIQVIVNPEYGELKNLSGNRKIATLITELHKAELPNIIPGFLISNSNDLAMSNETLIYRKWLYYNYINTHWYLRPKRT